jgi:hypothetical protein
MTLQEIEQALDAGRIFARMTNKAEWRVRRNGATKLWRTRPGDFRIPVKAGFHVCGYITPENFDHVFIVKDS